MENTKEDATLFADEVLKENLRIQKTAYIKQQLERQHAAEDARLERLMQEQEIIENLRESIDDSLWQTEESRKYNREFQERINMQIYESNGITGDKLTGMREYKNALYRGAAAVLFFLSLVLTVFSGVLHGFRSDICLLMFAYTAMEGVLLPREKKCPYVLQVIYRILNILTFPAMMVVFVCYELKYETYKLLLPYAVILGVVVTVLGILSYFLQDPYRRDKKKLREAKNQIRDIEKTAEKELRKKQKMQEKEERKAQNRAKKTGRFLTRSKRADQLPDEQTEEAPGALLEEALEIPLEERSEMLIEEKPVLAVEEMVVSAEGLKVPEEKPMVPAEAKVPEEKPEVPDEELEK